VGSKSNNKVEQNLTLKFKHDQTSGIKIGRNSEEKTSRYRYPPPSPIYRKTQIA
jgi:hypothetical protein